MRAISDFSEIYFCVRPVDFRKNIDGLAAHVEAFLGRSPFSGALFVFVNRCRDRVKILYFDRTGYALWIKRLEKEKFAWPRRLDEYEVALTPNELERFLEGFNIWSGKPHEALKFSKPE